ncbi:MAG: TonB-dependent receptor plug domain-containing protein [Bacteroidales bacterium]|nr:TonB-dependent receptor plug domain-containing protein [Bacteroidales bacterium]
MNKKLVLLGAAMLLTAASATAQKRVTGRVVDTSGQPVIGATVRVEGHKISVSTDGDGNFTLPDVPASAKQLNITCIGMKSQTVDVAGNVNVTMIESDNELGEVYVVAYGKATKASFTGAATQIKGEKVENKSTTEMTAALQGEVAGVQIVSTDGNPGAASNIYIRGIGSLYSNSQPLIILDGMPYGGNFSSIDPRDIETINIMKDATASALYGSRGANGVIIITTKRGAKGKLSISADVKYAVSGRWLPGLDVITSPERYTELTWEGMRNNYLYSQGYDADAAAAAASAQLFSSNGFPTRYNMWNAEGSALINPETGLFNSGITRRYEPDSWEDALYRTGQKVDAGINIAGGNDRSQYYTALSYVKDKGYVRAADYQRFNARTNVESQITDWLKGSVNFSYTNSERNAPIQEKAASNNAFRFIYQTPPPLHCL